MSFGTGKVLFGVRLATQWSWVRSPTTALSVGWYCVWWPSSSGHTTSGIPPATQANSASYPLWDREMSIGQSVAMLCGWE